MYTSSLVTSNPTPFRPGFIPGWAAIAAGVFSGSVPWFTMMVLFRRIALLRVVDDTLGVIHTHCITGILGGILTGVFTLRDLAAAFPTFRPSNGLIQGGGGQVRFTYVEQPRVFPLHKTFHRRLRLKSSPRPFDLVLGCEEGSGRS
jgi:hypothetical protein